MKTEHYFQNKKTGLVTKEQFSKLSNSEKGNIIFNEGKYIAVRYYYNYTINLYLYNSFYVEVFYSPDSNKIEVLEDLNKLDLYIDYMNKLKSE